MVIFFFNDTATTEIYTLSLHDALPIWPVPRGSSGQAAQRSPSAPESPPARAGTRLRAARPRRMRLLGSYTASRRSEEHTSELQSRQYLVCRLLLEKKNNTMSSPSAQSK